MSKVPSPTSVSPEPVVKACYNRVGPNCFLEQELWGRGVTAVAGVDEAGVGALASPVMAAAVILAPDAIVHGLADSKVLTPKRREALFAVISERAVAIAIGQAEVEEFDRLMSIGGGWRHGGERSSCYQPFRPMSSGCQFVAINSQVSSVARAKHRLAPMVRQITCD